MKAYPVFYFLYYAAAAALIPYLTLHYNALGLSGSAIGLLAALPSLAALMVSPLWGAAADASRRFRLVLLLAIGGALFSSQLLGWIGPSSPLGGGQSLFLLLLLAVLLFSLFSPAIMPLVDSFLIESLGEQRQRYGRIRLWGAVGWGVAAPLVGGLLDRFGMRAAFGAYLLLMGLGGLTAWRLPLSEHLEQRRLGASYWSGLRQLLRAPAWRGFLALAFLCGLSMSAISSFMFLRLEELHASRLLMGISLTAATLSELPVLYASDRLLRRFGESGVLLIGLGLYGLRLLLLGWLPAPSLVLGLQLLHGLTFSATWAAGVTLADRLAPPGISATAQGLFSGFYLGLGAATGSFLAGLLAQAVGLPSMFLISGVFVCLATGLAALRFRKTAQASTLQPGK